MPTLQHLSYSAVTKYLTNPYEFYRVYLQRKYRDDTSPAAAVGKAMHKAIELFYKGADVGRALEEGEKELERQAASIRFGETQSMEDCLAEYRSLCTIYFNSPVFNPERVVSVEEQIVAQVEGVKVKLKAITDLLGRAENGDLIIFDWKKVSKYTNPEIIIGYGLDGEAIKEEMIPAKYLIQAYFNYQTIKSRYREEPKSMVFVEIKATKNRDGSPQIRQYHIDFTSADVQRDFSRITRLINHIAEDVETRERWMPNPDDMYLGDIVWREWLMLEEPKPDNSQLALSV